MTTKTISQLRDELEELDSSISVEYGEGYFIFKDLDDLAARPVIAFPAWIDDEEEPSIDLNNLVLVYDQELVIEGWEDEEVAREVDVESLDDLLWEIDEFNRDFGGY